MEYLSNYLVKTPVLIINYKTYEEARGRRGLDLSKIADKMAKEYDASIIVVPQLPDVINIAQQVEIPVYAQHIDPNPSGSATGHIDPYTLKEGSVAGTLLNHSERRLETSILESSITLASKIGLETVVCAGTTGLSRALASFGPTAVAMEPPELIGGDVSVTTRPEVVKQAVELIQNSNSNVLPLVGAGVKNDEHIKVAIDLGSSGVLLASGIVKHAHPEVVLENMAKILSRYNNS